MNQSIYESVAEFADLKERDVLFEVDGGYMAQFVEVDPGDDEDPEAEPEGPEDTTPDQPRGRQDRARPDRTRPSRVRGRGLHEPENPDEPASAHPRNQEPEQQYYRSGSKLIKAGAKSTKTPDIIRQAGKDLRVIQLTYVKLNGEHTVRIIEPYSYRVQYPKRTGGAQRWYLFGFDRSKDQLIKSFLVRQIVSVQVGKEKFTPRWEVELASGEE